MLHLLPFCAVTLMTSGPVAGSPKEAWRERMRAQRHIRPHVNPLQRRYLKPPTDSLAEILNFADLTLPFHIDIGCGKGHFCADLAEARPDRNIVGIEIREQLVEEATRLCGLTGVGNLCFLAGSANVLVEPVCDALSTASLASVSINFPDPWPKRAHHKRRVVQPELAEALAKQLPAGGLVLVQSDIKELEDEMAATFLRSGFYDVDNEAASIAEAAGLTTILTERARQAARRHQPTWRTLLRRKDQAATHDSGRMRTPPAVMFANAVTNGMLNGSKFCVNVQLCVKPERRDEFIECIRQNQQGTLATEPLAIEYVWGEDTNVPHTFHFYEKYEGRAGFEAHQMTPHFRVWEEFADSDPFTSPPIVNFYEEY